MHQLQREHNTTSTHLNTVHEREYAVYKDLTIIVDISKPVVQPRSPGEWLLVPSELGLPMSKLVLSCIKKNVYLLT